MWAASSSVLYMSECVVVKYLSINAKPPPSESGIVSDEGWIEAAQPGGSGAAGRASEFWHVALDHLSDLVERKHQMIDRNPVEAHPNLEVGFRPEVLGDLEATDGTGTEQALQEVTRFWV